MQQHSFQVSYDEYEDITFLNEQDAVLLLAAREAIE